MFNYCKPGKRILTKSAINSFNNNNNNLLAEGLRLLSRRLFLSLLGPALKVLAGAMALAVMALPGDF